MKKIITLIISFVLIVVSVVMSGSAEGQRVYNWYCVRKSGHLQPNCEPSMSFIEEYNGYYVDKKHNESSQDKVIYLTFDAGYENGNVTKILDILKRENVSGAFFVLSHLIEANTELVKRMADEGHLVCNHTARHRDMTRYHTKEEFGAELDALNILYKDKIGREMPKYYRPPEGKFSEENLKFANELGYKTVFWSFAYADWDNAHQMSPAAAEKKILDNIHNGEVMLLHPTSATNVAVLGNIIRSLKSQGYRFGTLDELTKSV